MPILPSLLNGKIEKKARLSHAIRVKISQDRSFMITTDNVEELISRQLPKIDTQKSLIINLLSKELEDNQLGTVPVPYMSWLAGILGTVNDNAVARLFELSIEDRNIFKEEDSNRVYGLTPPAWERINNGTLSLPPTYRLLKFDYGSEVNLSNINTSTGAPNTSSAVDFENNLISITTGNLRNSGKVAAEIEKLIEELDGCRPKDEESQAGDNREEIPLSSQSFYTIRSLAAANWEIINSPRQFPEGQILLRRLSHLLGDLNKILSRLHGFGERVLALIAIISKVLTAISSFLK